MSYCSVPPFTDMLNQYEDESTIFVKVYCLNTHTSPRRTEWTMNCFVCVKWMQYNQPINDRHWFGVSDIPDIPVDSTQMCFKYNYRLDIILFLMTKWNWKYHDIRNPRGLFAQRKIAFIAIADLTRTFYVVGGFNPPGSPPTRLHCWGGGGKLVIATNLNLIEIPDSLNRRFRD